ncbi:MAG: YfhO family protein, partial [Elusimicrobiota bacterium]
LIHSLIAGIGMCLFLEDCKTDRTCAIIGAVLYEFGGFFVLRVEFFSQYFSYTWIPLIVYAYRSALNSGRLLDAFKISFLLSVQFFAGYPQFSFFTICLMLIFSEYKFPVECPQEKSTIPDRTGKNPETISFKSKFFVAAITIVVFVLMAAVQIIPSIKLIFNSVRSSGLDYEKIVVNSVHPKDFLRFVLFPLWNWYLEIPHADPHIIGVYFGIVSILPFILGFAAIKASRRNLLILSGTLFISLILSFGEYLPGYGLLVNFLFPLKYLRYPGQWLGIFSFCYVFVAAKGLERFNIKYKTIWTAALFIELLMFGIKANPTIDRRFFHQKFPTIEFLKTDASLFRHVLTPRTESVMFRTGTDVFDVWVRFADTLFGSFSMTQRLFEAGGAEVLVLSRYKDVLDCVKRNPESKWMDIANVKYIGSFWEIASSKFMLVSKSKDFLVYLNKKFVPRIYFANKTTFKQKDEILNYVEGRDFDPLNEVVVENTEDVLKQDIEKSMPCNYQINNVMYSPHRVEFNITTDCPGIAVLSDTWYKGWKAEVNGIKTRVLRVNYCFRGVKIERGENTVVFYYSPVSFKLGMIITCITFGIYMFLLFRNRTLKMYVH